MSSPAPQSDPRLVLTVRTSAERHADGEYHARLTVSGLPHDPYTAGHGDEREEARCLAIGRALRTIGVAICTGDMSTPATIDIVDAPAEESR